MIERAALWAAQLATDEATQADHDACEAWCREDPRHRLAMDRMRGFDRQFGRTDGLEREVIETLLEQRSQDTRSGKARRFGGLALGLVVLAAGGWLAAQSLTVRAFFPEYATQRGEQQTVTLTDGSRLTLDTDAALDFRRSDDSRTVSLFQGQVLARVAREKGALNAPHPFIVQTGDGTATAHGTAFVVRRDEHATTVTVIESAVRVCLAPPAAGRCADLLPGDRARMANGRLTRLGRVDPDVAAAWSEGWLAADDEPVTQVLDELNRYRARPVSFDRSALADYRVSGSFPLSDTDRALEGIVRSTGLALSSADDGALVVGRTK
ncbi:iron dicitrate transport regulator FecR [Novosphingobium guangzhouense]|uniref:Iron dicitrate transport regulator FecR n=1 Tax=Novosphingobium guangzhouense TaxID=1850347 RepID=A0A2K2FWY3_9SPHN|nr:iron dicitrate transport regulator FecR [Novosphingobium guangzhouense]